MKDFAWAEWRLQRNTERFASVVGIIRLVDVSSSGHVLCELDGWRLSKRFGWSSETRRAHKGAWLSERESLLKYWGGLQAPTVSTDGKSLFHYLAFVFPRLKHSSIWRSFIGQHSKQTHPGIFPLCSTLCVCLKVPLLCFFGYHLSCSV